MIIRDTSNRTQEGNLQGETIQMGISDIRLIIDRLTDLYSDRELACIREYSTNARDAHIESGIVAPIEVSTPGPLAPFLTIRDFGVGLSVEDIREIYSQYGASTKRNTNAQTGALGLGCKSALSYSDQFTVTSVKDGVRIQVVVSRDPKMGASMKVVDTSDTTEPNGTTVIIPAKGYNEIERKAKEFFSYWELGTVKLNGVEPEKLPNAKWVTDKLAIVEGGGFGAQNKLVMGGVPYPAPNLNPSLGYGKSLVAFVEIGDVDFAPSREGLMDTDETTKTLRRVEGEFKRELQKSIIKDIEAAATPGDAYRRKQEWANSVPSQFMPSTATYKGSPIPSGVKMPAHTICTSRNERKMSAPRTLTHDLPMDTALNSLYVHGFDYASFTATVRKKLEKWLEDHDKYDLYSFGGYVLVSGDMSTVDQTWLDNPVSVDWPTLKAIKLPRATKAATASGRIPGSYDIWENGDWNEGVPGDDIDTSHDIFWMNGTRYWDGREVAAWLAESYPKGCTLVMLRSGREAKFQRNFPQAKEAGEVIKVAFDKWVKKVNKDDATAMAIRQSQDMRLGILPIDRLKDPEIAHAIKVAKRDTSKLEKQIAAWAALGYHYSVNGKGWPPNPLTKYILLPEAYYLRRYNRPEQMDHIVRYMNCEYAASQGSK